MSPADQGKPDQGCILALGFALEQVDLRSPPHHSLVVLALVLRDVQLRV